MFGLSMCAAAMAAEPGGSLSKIEKQNAAEQADALNQDPGGADRSKLLADRLKDPISAGLLGVRTEHPDAQWFADGPIGLFVHWGIASVDGNADLSWPMIKNMGQGRKIKPAEYWALADRFKAEHYDPNVWLKAAKDAGFTYAVLTTKHHDGYTLFPTDKTEMGVRTKLGGRDLVREFADACRANGLKVGFYFSGPDWWQERDVKSFNYRSEGPGGSNSSLPAIPGRRALDKEFNEWDAPGPTPELIEKMRAANHQQLRELLTRYEKIDVLWFDGGSGSDITLEEIRQLQPGIVINNRGGLKSSTSGQPWAGDYFTFEHGEPLERPPGWWEMLRIWNSPNWGYVAANESRYASTASILATLAKTRAWGGALLANTGPRPDGTMPDPFYRGMREFGLWMKSNGESVVHTSPAPAGVKSNVPITVRGQRWYLHALPAAGNEITLASDGLLPTFKAAFILATGEKVLFERQGDTLRLKPPASEKNRPHDVIVLDVNETH